MSRLIENCTFTFQCPRTWDQLERTGETNVRFCGQCERRVHLCTTDEELTRHARDRHCVAVRTPIAPSVDASVGRQGNCMIDDRKGMLMLGEPALSPLYNSDNRRGATRDDLNESHV